MHNASLAPDLSMEARHPFIKLYAWAVIVTIGASLIGPASFNIGVGKVVLLPMVWAIIAGGILGLSQRHMPTSIRLSTDLQHLAAAVLQPSLLLFTAKLGLMVGVSLPKLVASGWALMFQELGHFAGTICLGLPLALFLGIKREAIGATFSVGREPSLAIIGERYGMNSAEGRGVLAEYLTGTIFGAVFITILAGALASMKVFSPIALAMGAGVGSGSMMASAAGAIAAVQTPDVAADVMTFAAASNLLTTTFGTFFTLFISLPLASLAYRYLEPIIGRTTSASDVQAGQSDTQAALHKVGLTELQKYGSWVVLAILSLATNQILHKTPLLTDIEGTAFILIVVAICDMAAKFTRGILPAVCLISVITMALTSPISPWAQEIIGLTKNMDFLAFAPPVLAFAGLSLAKDVPAFRRLGWRIVLVSFVANAGSFVGAALIAHVIGNH